MKLLSTKSMIRYFPPNGTAGLARSLVSGKRRVPLPPASTIPSTRMRIVFYQGLLFQASRGMARGRSGIEWVGHGGLRISGSGGNRDGNDGAGNRPDARLGRLADDHTEPQRR